MKRGSRRRLGIKSKGVGDPEALIAIDQKEKEMFYSAKLNQEEFNVQRDPYCFQLD